MDYFETEKKKGYTRDINLNKNSKKKKNSRNMKQRLY